MDDDTYLEIFDTRTGQFRKTNIGAVFTSVEETIAAFESARRYHVDRGPFTLDLFINGDIVDTIGLTQQGVALVSGEDVLPPDVYEAMEIMAVEAWAHSCNM